MAMAKLSHLFPSNFILTPRNPKHHSVPYHHRHQRRHLSVLAMASSSFSVPLSNAEYLEKEFKGHGVSFAGIGDNCVVRMGLDNGSVANLMLPTGLITSYKAHMWYGSTLELLHTTVSEGEEGVVVQGGMSMDFKCGNTGGVTWSPSTWVLHDVRGDGEQFTEVELRSRDAESMVEFKNIVTLQPDVLISEVVISNLKSSPLTLTGSYMSHITVSTPDATFAVGLEGSDYYSKPPFVSDFSIVPPEDPKSKPGVFQGIMSGWSGSGDKKDSAEPENNVGETEEMDGEEQDNYAQLTDKSSRIYTSAPREFTIIDRGRRNSISVGRYGFEEQYIFSPGANHDWYGKYAYICTGPSAVLKPIILDAQQEWKGGQFIQNPNL